ncbi:MAG: HAMP domain-containing protein [Betaproteobacteria bacterium]|nr:HAMP domain-containing protein [Betaproteobacteria bacterium]
MYKLFWKFFFTIWIAQLITIWGAGTAIWYIRHHEPLSETNLDLSNGASYYLDPVLSSLKSEGISATAEYLKKRFRRIVYVVDTSTNKELLNRKIPLDFLDLVRQKTQQASSNHAIQELTLGDRRYLLFVVDIPSPWGNKPLLPVFPLTGATLASLLFAFLLARHFSRPIELLKETVEQVGLGKFDIQLHTQLTNRQDSLGELAVDIQHMTTRLGKVIDSQTRLLHTISHELRSPLTRLQMATGLLRQKSSENNDEIERIERECKRIDLLIGQLLTLSRLDDEISKQEIETVNFNPLINEIIENAKFEAQSLQKTVIDQSSSDLINVEGNPILLYYAIENVIRNALRHARKTVWIGHQLMNNAVKIYIIDDGEGVDDADLAQITQPFYRASNTQKNPNMQGFGLGLAITQKTFKAHNGEVIFSNLPNKTGFKVELILPLTLH